MFLFQVAFHDSMEGFEWFPFNRAAPVVEKCV